MLKKGMGGGEEPLEKAPGMSLLKMRLWQHD